MLNFSGAYEMESRFVGGKLLRCGYTTGTCAAAAAKAAAAMLLDGAICRTSALRTPNGIELVLDVAEVEVSPEYVRCAIQKDSGDDPDITNGCLVYAKVQKTSEGIVIRGGEGVGRVTKPGLDQPVGAHAINSVPRRMIVSECEAVCRERGYEGGLSVTISIPNGEALARRTFNPRLGIVGGLSILGTTGIVEPMSEAAIVSTIDAELSILAATGFRNVVLTIGNHGEAFARERLGLGLESHVKCSNFVGETLASAAAKGFEKALLIGHIGKLVKLGIGITNTHSNRGDGRMETLITCALEAGASLEILQGILHCVSTDAALDCLHDAGLLSATMNILRIRIEDTLSRHIAGSLEIGLVCFRGLGAAMEEVFSL